MEVLVQLPIAAVVLVGGLDGHVKKVWTALHKHCNAPIAVIVLASTPIFYTLYMFIDFGRENVHSSQ